MRQAPISISEVRRVGVTHMKRTDTQNHGVPFDQASGHNCGLVKEKDQPEKSQHSFGVKVCIMLRRGPTGLIDMLLWRKDLCKRVSGLPKTRRVNQTQILDRSQTGRSHIPQERRGVCITLINKVSHLSMVEVIVQKLLQCISYFSSITLLIHCIESQISVK